MEILGNSFRRKVSNAKINRINELQGMLKC